MGIPRQIQQQHEEAVEKQQALEAAQKEQAQAVETQTQQQEQAQEAQPAVDDSAPVVPETPVEARPETPEPQEATGNSEVQQLKAELEKERKAAAKAKERYISESGRRKKVEHMLESRTGIEDVSGQISSLMQKINGLEEQLSEKSRVPPEQRALDPSELEQIDPDDIDRQKRLITEVSGDLIDGKVSEATKKGEAARAKLEQEQADLRRQLDEERQQSFKRELSILVPEWEEINDEPEWHAFLNVTDQASGMARRDLAQSAMAQRSAERTAYFFKAYQEQKNGTQATTVQDARVSQTGPKTVKAEVVPTPNQAPVMGDSDAKRIRELYSQGKISDEQAQRMISEIYESANQGKYVRGR